MKRDAWSLARSCLRRVMFQPDGKWKQQQWDKQCNNSAASDRQVRHTCAGEEDTPEQVPRPRRCLIYYT